MEMSNIEDAKAKGIRILEDLLDRGKASDPDKEPPARVPRRS